MFEKTVRDVGAREEDRKDFLKEVKEISPRDLKKLARQGWAWLRSWKVLREAGPQDAQARAPIWWWAMRRGWTVGREQGHHKASCIPEAVFRKWHVILRA